MISRLASRLDAIEEAHPDVFHAVLWIVIYSAGFVSGAIISGLAN